MSSCAPRRSSSAATCLLIAGCPVPSSRATAEKLPLSTTRTNILFDDRFHILPDRLHGGAETLTVGVSGDEIGALGRLASVLIFCKGTVAPARARGARP
jgi:hypothetical protein